MPTRAELGERLLRLVDVDDAAVFVLDRDWACVYANDAALALLALDDFGLAAAPPLVDPDSQGSTFTAAYRRVMDGGPAEEVEDHHAELGIHLHTRVLPVEGGIAVVLRDVTEERQLSHRLLRDRDLYAQVLAHTTTAIALRDLDGRYLLANPAFCDFSGLSEDEITGQTARELFPEDLAGLIDAADDRVRRTRQVEEAHGEGSWPGRPGRTVVAQVFPVLDGQRRLVGTGTTATDVSRVLELEAELSASRRRYRDVFHSTSLGVLLIAADGPVLEANTAICRMLGWSRQELLSMRGPDLLPVTGRDAAAERAKVLAEGPLGYEEEVELARSDGHRLPVLVTVNVFPGPDDESQLVSVLVRDQTSVHELQQRLLAAERLEVAGRMAAGVAHDANNILAAASGYADLLRGEVQGSAAAQRHLGGIDRTIERAGELVAQLVDFTHGREVQAGPLDLALVTQDLEEILRRVLPDGVDLALDLAAAPALADPVQARQVVLNLVVNARDAVRGGGTIRVTSGLQVLAGDGHLADGVWAFVSVADDGEGMDEAVARRCFEPFFSTRGARGGTGLGLSTAYAIARRSGGDLRVRTAPGRGADFRLLLPSAAAAALQAGPEVPLPPARAAGRAAR